MDEQGTPVTVDGSTRGVIRDPERPAPSGLAVCSERRTDVFILWLSGALDRVTSALLERELAALARHVSRLVLDLTGLEFIDSHGLEALVQAQQRARESDQRLSFRHGPHVGQRPFELTRGAGLRSRAASRPANGMDVDDYLFALAMASADVDHQRPRDRPRGTRTRFLVPARRRSAVGASGNPAR